MDQILSILGSVGFNWHVALANFINFLIILFLLNKFFFGKIGKTIKTRQEIIERGISQASDAEKALTSAEEQKKVIIKSAQKEGTEIIEQAEKNAESLAQTIIASAEQEAQMKLDLLAQKEAKLRVSLEKEIAVEIPHIVARLYAKTLKEEMTQKENDALIARMNI